MNQLYALLAIKILQCLTCRLLNLPSASTDRLMVLFYTFIKGAFLFKIADVHHQNTSWKLALCVYCGSVYTEYSVGRQTCSRRMVVPTWELWNNRIRGWQQRNTTDADCLRSSEKMTETGKKKKTHYV